MPNVTKCCIQRSASQEKTINIEINNELLKGFQKRFLFDWQIQLGIVDGSSFVNKTISDGGITVDFWFIKVHTSN